MMFKIFLASAAVTCAHAAKEDRKLCTWQGDQPDYIEVSGLNESEYADPNGIYVKANVSDLYAFFHTKGTILGNCGHLDIPFCYVQVQVFADQPAWIIVPCKMEWNNRHRYYWSMLTTGAWQRAAGIEKAMEGSNGDIGSRVARLARGNWGFIRSPHLDQMDVNLNGRVAHRPNKATMLRSMPMIASEYKGTLEAITDVSKAGEKLAGWEGILEAVANVEGKGQAVFQKAAFLFVRVVIANRARQQRDSSIHRAPVGGEPAHKIQSLELGDQKEDDQKSAEVGNGQSILRSRKQPSGPGFAGYKPQKPKRRVSFSENVSCSDGSSQQMKGAVGLSLAEQINPENISDEESEDDEDLEEQIRLLQAKLAKKKKRKSQK